MHAVGVWHWGKARVLRGIRRPSNDHSGSQMITTYLCASYNCTSQPHALQHLRSLTRKLFSRYIYV